MIIVTSIRVKATWGQGICYVVFCHDDRMAEWIGPGTPQTEEENHSVLKVRGNCCPTLGLKGQPRWGMWLQTVWADTGSMLDIRELSWPGSFRLSICVSISRFSVTWCVFFSRVLVTDTIISVHDSNRSYYHACTQPLSLLSVYLDFFFWLWT